MWADKWTCPRRRLPARADNSGGWRVGDDGWRAYNNDAMTGPQYPDATWQSWSRHLSGRGGGVCGTGAWRDGMHRIRMHDWGQGARSAWQSRSCQVAREGMASIIRMDGIAHDGRPVPRSHMIRVARPVSVMAAVIVVFVITTIVPGSTFHVEPRTQRTLKLATYQLMSLPLLSRRSASALPWHLRHSHITSRGKL